MFKYEEYYSEAQSGEAVNNKLVIEHLKTFENVIIWGASYLGKAVGQYLSDSNVKIKQYWDLRYESIGPVDGVECVQPFEQAASESTIIVFCIANNIIRGLLLKELSVKGYVNVLRGDYLYMGAICPLDKNSGIESSQCQGSMCCRSIFCQRLSNIVKARKPIQENLIHNFSITLVINQRCSLKCKDCTSYMNEYPIDKKTDVPFERICEDIDRFFEAMDSVGTITVMGGEPFMHPNIADIIKKLLTKQNFGIISIATTGTYPIKPEQLEGLQDPRVNVSFSNYEHALKPKQTELMYTNIELVKAAGVAYTVGVTIPEWAVPSTLYDLQDSEQTMKRKKKSCVQPPRCMQIKNGKLHPCDFGTALYCLGIDQSEMDYVDIEHSTSNSELREKIRAFIEQPYYQACGFCAGMRGLTSKAAEQGYTDFKLKK